MFYIETMATNTKLISKEFVCVDKRIGYLALLIVPAVILIVISGMINSQKMTQNSRASEQDKINNIWPWPTKTPVIPIPEPTLKTYYIKPIMDVCFDSLDDIRKMLMYEYINDESYDEAWSICYKNLVKFIISNDGKWPEPVVIPTPIISKGFSVTDKVAKAWVDKGFLRSRGLYNYPSGTLQLNARDVIIKYLKIQRESLTEPLKFSR